MSDSVSGITSGFDTYDTYASRVSSGTMGLQQSLSSDLSNATDEELMDVCKEFESYFIEQVFKNMEKMVPKADEEESSNNTLVDYFKGEMISKYASMAADSDGGNGLGIAQTLYEQMKRNYASND